MDSSVSPRPRRVGRILGRVAWFVVVTSILGYVSLSLVVAYILTRTNNRPNTIGMAAISLSAVPWTTQTADGLTLRGFYCPTGQHQRLIVLVHGMGGNRDEMAGIAKDLHANGFDVLIFDLRGHGDSDPSRLYMGDRERGDIRAVLAWAKSAGYSSDRIGWIGHSMGGAALVMEGEQNPEIGAVVLDSAYGDLPELLDRQLNQHSGLPRLFNPGILLAARFVYGVRTDNLIPIRSAQGWGRPIVLIHGEDDSVVPVEQARRLARAFGSSCQPEYRPHVEHVGAYHDSPDWYIATVTDFFDKNLARPTPSPSTPETHP